MTETELVARAIELIGKLRTARSPRIAEELAIAAENVHVLLQPEIEAGRLIGCVVALACGSQVMEYRLSMAGGGTMPAPPALRSTRPRTPPVPPRTARGAAEPSPHAQAPESTTNVPPRTARGAVESTPNAQAPESTTNKEAEMKTTDKIIAAYKAHGPMTVPELRKHCAAPNIAKACSALTARGVLARLGGGEKSSVYGLPGQKAPAAAAAGKVRDWAKRDGKRAQRKPRKARAQRVQAGRHWLAELPPAKRGPNGFRPAIAADGALLLIGAAQAGELDRAETRVLAEFLRRIDRTGRGRDARERDRS